MQTTLQNSSLAVPTFLKCIPSKEELRALAAKNKFGFQNNTPFPHAMFDAFLPQDTAEALLENFPKPSEPIWMSTSIGTEKKLSVSEESVIPSPLLDVLYALNGATFLSFLEELSGIEGLIPDPYFSGGGLHQIESGGHLGVHIDFNKYPKFNFERRLNLLVYLNKDWKEDYGGHLEVWKDTNTGCVKKYLPIFNRCVIFSTSEKSLHGHPHPLTCPPTQSRKSIALYYYTNGRDRKSRAFVHGTDFVQKTEKGVGIRRLRLAITRVIREWTPPVIYRTAKGILSYMGYDGQR